MADDIGVCLEKACVDLDEVWTETSGGQDSMPRHPRELVVVVGFEEVL